MTSDAWKDGLSTRRKVTYSVFVLGGQVTAARPAPPGPATGLMPLAHHVASLVLKFRVGLSKTDRLPDGVPFPPLKSPA